MRLLVKDITIKKNKQLHEVVLNIRWQGGSNESLIVDLPEKRYAHTVEKIRSLAEFLTDTQIAKKLNTLGISTSKGNPFNKARVSWIRYQYSIPSPQKLPNEFTAKEIAKKFEIDPGVIHRLIRKGLVKTRRKTPHAPHWIMVTPDIEEQLEKMIANSNRYKKQQPEDTLVGGVV